MKRTIIIIVTVLASLSALATVFMPFQDWDQVEKNSSDIVVAAAWDENPPHGELVTRKADYQIQIISVLTGTNVSGFVRLLANHEFDRGRKYLIFGVYSGSYLDAPEDYRAIPLARNFQAKLLKDKTFDEKLQILFQSGVDYMNQKI